MPPIDKRRRRGAAAKTLFLILAFLTCAAAAQEPPSPPPSEPRTLADEVGEMRREFQNQEILGLRRLEGVETRMEALGHNINRILLIAGLSAALVLAFAASRQHAQNRLSGERVDRSVREAEILMGDIRRELARPEMEFLRTGNFLRSLMRRFFDGGVSPVEISRVRGFTEDANLPASLHYMARALSAAHERRWGAAAALLEQLRLMEPESPFVFLHLSNAHAKIAETMADKREKKRHAQIANQYYVQYAEIVRMDNALTSAPAAIKPHPKKDSTPSAAVPFPAAPRVSPHAAAIPAPAPARVSPPPAAIPTPAMPEVSLSAATIPSPPPAQVSPHAAAIPAPAPQVSPPPPAVAPPPPIRAASPPATIPPPQNTAAAEIIAAQTPRQQNAGWEANGAAPAGANKIPEKIRGALPDAKALQGMGRFVKDGCSIIWNGVQNTAQKIGGAESASALPLLPTPIISDLPERAESEAEMEMWAQIRRGDLCMEQAANVFNLRRRHRLVDRALSHYTQAQGNKTNRTLYLNWGLALLGKALHMPPKKRDPFFNAAVDKFLAGNVIAPHEFDFALASLYAIIGRGPECRRWLEASRQSETLDMESLRHAADFDGVRGQPWFAEFMQ